MASKNFLAERLKFMRLDGQALATLAALRPLFEIEVPKAVDGLYAHVQQFPQIRGLFSDSAHLARARDLQVSHWLKFLAGNFDDNYVQAVRKIGQAHHHIGLETRWYLGGYTYILSELLGQISRQVDGGKRVQAIHALTRAVTLDMDFALSVILEENERANRSTLASLIEQEARFNDFAEAATDWFWEMDADLRFSYISERYSIATGLDLKVLMGKTREESGIPEVDPQAWRQHLSDLKAHRQFRNFNHARTRPDGKVIGVSVSGKPHFDEDGNFKGYRGICRDITDQELRERELKRAKIESEAERNRLQNAIDSICDGFVLWDRDDRLVVCNKAFRNQFSGIGMETGVSVDELMLRFARTGRVAQAVGREEEWVSEVLRDRKAELGKEIVFQTHDGRWIRRLDQTTANGERAGIRSDVTALKLREAELEEARRDAEMANQQKSEFLANMSHEIRTPLNGVLGMSELLIADEKLAPAHREMIEIIKSSGTILLKLLNDILDISKIEAGQFEIECTDFSIVQLVGSASALWEAQIKAKGIGYSVRADNLIAPALMGDPTRLRQILFNLINNASKFTKTGEIIVQVSQKQPVGNRIETRFEVIDTGIGISPENRDLLFNKFTQADTSTTRKYGGSGLGLAVCKKLIGLMGGEIGIDSEPGVGSTFWFTVDCEMGVADQSESARNDDRADNRQTVENINSLRVLVAEDNDINQLVMRRMLEDANHQVVIVGDGMEAVKAVMRMPFDIVLMDIQMPGTDGICATQLIRELPGECAWVPIIAITANAMKHDREKYLAAGMNDYVSKPVDPKALTRAINDQIRAASPKPARRGEASHEAANVNVLDCDGQEEQSDLENSAIVQLATRK